MTHEKDGNSEKNLGETGSRKVDSVPTGQMEQNMAEQEETAKQIIDAIYEKWDIGNYDVMATKHPPFKDASINEIIAQIMPLLARQAPESALMVTIANLHATLIHALEKCGAPTSVVSALNESGDIEHVDWWITVHAPSVQGGNENV
jgi:hypothetical protein